MASTTIKFATQHFKICMHILVVIQQMLSISKQKVIMNPYDFFLFDDLSTGAKPVITLISIMVTLKLILKRAWPLWIYHMKVCFKFK